MSRAMLSTVLVVSLVSSVHADATLKQTVDGKGAGMSGSSPVATFIKGNRMRSDTLMGDKTQTMIFDVDAQKLYTFDSKKKEADVWDMAAFGQQIGKSVDPAAAKTSFKANGQTKTVGGHSAAGYDLDTTMPTSMGGGDDMSMTVTLHATLWIVKGVPGSADYSRFYKAAADKGFVFTNPQAAKAQPGQAKAMAEMYRQVADLGGLPYETDMDIKMGGSGPMAGLLGRMGNLTMTTVINTVETGALADDLFAPPAGYKLNIKK
jgi:hypothetical protein